MSARRNEPVLLSGATGFVGRRLFPELRRRGYEVVCGSRNPDRGRRRFPKRRWVELDVDRPETVRRALEGCGSAFYLVHQMTGEAEYLEREQRAARGFLRAAEANDLHRIVYLGGVEPAGRPSTHLQSRLAVGRVLRSGTPSSIELRASMIIGSGSAGWRIVRDLAARLPAMILPAWTRSRTQPVGIGDVVEALVAALELDDEGSAWFDIPGPETMTVAEILRRTANLMGNDPVVFDVPVLSPRISSYWLKFVTGTDSRLARALVEGLRHDLLAESDAYWKRIGHEQLVSFDEAARRAMEPTDSPAGQVLERLVHSVTSLRRS